MFVLKKAAAGNVDMMRQLIINSQIMVRRMCCGVNCTNNGANGNGGACTKPARFGSMVCGSHKDYANQHIASLFV
jgi:hypothetical protein